MKCLIKEWHKDNYNLRLYDIGKYINGRVYLAYKFHDTRSGVRFEGDDFSPSPLYAIDSMQTVYSLLGFLGVQPGDVDEEYFDSYTPDQLNWARSQRCENLHYIVPEKYNR